MLGKTALEKARQWLGVSIKNRITAAMVLLTTSTILFCAIISYLGASYFIIKKTNDEMLLVGKYASLELASEIGKAVKDIQGLSQQSLVANAIVDSLGRDAYLHPFLKTYQSGNKNIASISLLDYKGRPLSSVGMKGGTPYLDKIIRQTLEQRHAYVEVVTENGIPMLLLAFPVLFKPTQSVEGIFITKLHLGNVFAEVAGNLNGNFSYALLNDRKPVWPRHAGSANNGTLAFSEEAPLPLPGNLSKARLAFKVSSNLSGMLYPIYWLSLGYLLLGLLSFAGIALFARFAAEKLTLPLRHLSDTFDSITKDGVSNWNHTVVSGIDELASLDIAFNRMFDAIKKAQLNLENTVEQRTALLTEASNNLANVLSSMQDVIYSISDDLQTVLYISPAAKDLFQRDEAELYENGSHWLGMIHEEDRPQVVQILQNAQAGKNYDIEYRIRLHTGETKWVKDRFRVANNPEADVKFSLNGCLTDITERVLLRHARSRMEQVLYLKERALASSNNGIMIISAGKKYHGVVEYINPAFERLSGFAATEIVGRDWAAGMKSSLERSDLKLIFRKSIEKDGFHREFRVRNRSGKPFWCELSVSPVFSPGRETTHYIAVISDVSERIETAKRHQYVVESIKEVIFQTDVSGAWTYLNPAWMDITGFAVTDSIGTPFFHYVHPDDRQKNLELFQPLIERKKDFCRHVVRYLTQAGGFKWIEVYATLIFNEQGEVSGTSGTLMDVTEQRLAEEVLRIRDRAMQSSLNGILIADMQREDQPLIYVNAAFERITGYRQDEVVGRNCRFLQGEDTDQEGLIQLKHAIQEQRECEVVVRNYRKDGTLFWNHLSISPVRDPDGKVTHYVGSQNDITLRRNAEFALQEWAAKLDTIFNLSPDGFVCFDAEGRIEFVNPAFEQMTGLKTSQIKGWDQHTFDTQLHSLLDPEQTYFPARPAVTTAYAGAAVTEDGADDLTWPSATENDKLYLIRPARRVLQRSTRRASEVNRSRIVYFRDITHEDEIDRMKSEFLSTAAHELRTPMASIMGFSELLLHRRFEEADRKDVVETIYKQSINLTKLINELLDLARIEARAGKDFHILPQPIRPLIEQTIQELLIPGDNRTVCFDWPATAHLVALDQDKFKQALLNVLSNAYKYSPLGGAIRVSAALRQRSTHTEIGVCVEDEGMGMSPEAAVKAFDRFYRADTSGNIPGTGLGLSLVKEIVEIHRGEVELVSVQGEGTRVTLWFPLIAEAQAEK